MPTGNVSLWSQHIFLFLTQYQNMLAIYKIKKEKFSRFLLFLISILPNHFPIRFSSYVFIRLNDRQKSHRLFSMEFKCIDMCNECATNNTLTHTHRVTFSLFEIRQSDWDGEEDKMNEKRWSENKMANGIEYCILQTLHSLLNEMMERKNGKRIRL